jgi:hypothetical protein
MTLRNWPMLQTFSGTNASRDERVEINLLKSEPRLIHISSGMMMATGSDRKKSFLSDHQFLRSNDLGARRNIQVEALK